MSSHLIILATMEACNFLSLQDCMYEIFPPAANSTEFFCKHQSSIFSWRWTKHPIFTKSLRGLSWRLSLGVLTSYKISDWTKELVTSVDVYSQLKTKVMPKIEDVQMDPLTAAFSNEQKNEWDSYYKNIELVNFIKGDLGRLYMNGIDDDFFQTSRRKELVLNVLFVWSAKNPRTSYRQGMHEIVGPVLYVLESELECFKSEQARLLEINGGVPNQQSNEFCSFANAFTDQTLEAYVYWVFEKIMDQLEPLYDPTVRPDGQPQVVHFCTNLQENLLRQLDPELCDHLEETFIQAQLYGMRWSRLILGREFSCTDTHNLRVWDFVFASCIPPELLTSSVSNVPPSATLPPPESAPESAPHLAASQITGGVRISVPVGGVTPSRVSIAEHSHSRPSGCKSPVRSIYLEEGIEADIGFFRSSRYHTVLLPPCSTLHCTVLLCSAV